MSIYQFEECLSPLKQKGSEKKNTNDAWIECGKCLPCLSRRSNDWVVRIGQEMKRSDSAFFITLTYNTTHLPLIDCRGFKTALAKEFPKGCNRRTGELRKEGHIRRYEHLDVDQVIGMRNGVFEWEPTLWKRDLQMFVDRLRKRNVRAGGKHTKYFAGGEYGDQFDRPHYHLIVFNILPEVKLKLQEIWPFGWVDVRKVTGSRIKYTTKYIFKRYDARDAKEPFHIVSQGMGSNYVNSRTKKYHQQTGKTGVRDTDGWMKRMPRYYKDKIWPEEEFPGKKRADELHNNSKKMLEYWQEWSKLKEQGVRDPDQYMQTIREYNQEMNLKRKKK